MKFKKIKEYSPDCKTIVVKTEGDDILLVQTREDGKPGLFVDGHEALITRSKALKLAWAIIDELNPSQLG